MNKYNVVQPVELNAGFDFVSRADVDFGMDNPATDIMHDFRLEPPAVIDERADVEEALRLMKRARRRFRLVVNSQDHLKGVLTSENLRDPRVLAKAEGLGIRPGEVPIIHVMTPAAFLYALPYRTLRTARVGDIVETLRQIGDSVLIVTQGDGKVRGLILMPEFDLLRIDPDIRAAPKHLAGIPKAIRH